MTVYPSALDDDRTIIRIDDNIAELGTQAINQLRDAVFAIEKELGLDPAGTVGSVAGFLSVAHNPNGTIKASALASVGLVSLPIDDAQVGINAGIKESKLALNHSTTDLYTQLTANSALINSTAAFLQTSNSDLLIHISGGTTLSDGSTAARHVGSQIDLNTVPSDPRDPSFIWSGLKDKDGNDRTATTVGAALDQINTSLITHENATSGAHPATAVTVDTSNFTEIPSTATDVQQALDDIDDADRLNIGDHRAVMHDNGVPRTARSQLIDGPDGYSQPIVPVTPCNAFLVRPPATSPVDNNAYGDDLIVFNPDNTGQVFDTQFTQVKVGDMLRINYGTGVEAIFPVESIRYQPGVSWVIRVNGVNLENTDGYDAYARIDRPLFDDNTSGVFAVAAANHFLPTYPRTILDASIMSSAIVADPRGATALGLGFDPNQLDSSHYLLYLNLYPTGTPSGRVIQMPGIDVTGNQGTTPGQYTIDSVVQATNDSLRAAGYNLRFIAFNHNGEFGIMLVDVVDGASFSIINGIITAGALAPGSFGNNVVADADTLSGYDALGLGRAKAGLASPDISSYSAAEAAANYPTLIIPPLRNRNAVVNGVRRNAFIATYGTQGDGYWLANVTDVLTVGGTTVEVEYTVNEDMCRAELKAGKTILVQPTLAYSDSDNQNQDYGRFVIKEVAFTPACGATPATTTIRVLNGVHWSTNPLAPLPSDNIQVRLYFGEDAVSFNESNVVDAVPSGISYNRFHEIYLDDLGKTFSHERARLPKQVEDGSLPAGTLFTDNTNWTITNVSPKLRGFRDDDGSFRKYIRFYVLNYNTTTGEYDGYIGRRDVASDNILEFGEVVRARKDVPAKFYDATNIDYIELMFSELSSTTTAIMTTNDPRFVDIEMFESLALDDEFFLLASCDLDENTVERMMDRREFGTISEKNFSASAISFIESGDRYLHANGVLRGLGFQGPDPGDPSLMTFNGGVALVNGHISVVNDGNVRIPEIRETGSSTPVSYDWAICVNDKDQFEPILLTSSKQEFFALGSPDYYVTSVTFTELVNSRNDLTPIAVVAVTISSMSVDSVTDIRKFVGAETANLPLTLSQPTSRPNTSGSDEGLVGNFSTFEQLSWWLDRLNGSTGLVKVRGNVTIANPSQFSSDALIFEGDNQGTITFQGLIDFDDSDVTFRNMNVVFEGTTTDWASSGRFSAYNVTFTTDSTINLRQNVTIRDCSFVYDPTSVGSADNDYINSSLGACLRFGTSTIARVTIDRCTFSSTTDNRPPYILVNRASGSSVGNVNNVRVDDCRFTDDSATEDHAAVVLEWVETGSFPAAFTDIWITNNHCAQSQTIVFAPRGDLSGGINRGVTAQNVHISGNRCAIIGYNAAHIDDTFSDRPGLVISGNSVRAILCPVRTDPTNSAVTSKHFEITAVSGMPTNNVYITDNTVSGPITATIGNKRSDRTSIKIMGNTVLYDANYTQVHTDWGWDAAIAAGGIGGLGGAISVISGNTSQTDQDRTSMIISGNRVTSWRTSPTVGIAASASGIISDNEIYGLAADPVNSRGIYCVFAQNSFVNITGNRVSPATFIQSFIEIDEGGTTSLGGVIADNYLERPDPTGSGDYDLAITAPSAWVVERNKNHQQSVNVFLPSCSFALERSGDVDSFLQYGLTREDTGVNPVKSRIQSAASGAVGFWYDEASASVPGVFWAMIRASDVAPVGSKITSIEVEWETNFAGTPLTEADLRWGMYKWTDVGTWTSPDGQEEISTIDVKAGASADGSDTLNLTGTWTATPNNVVLIKASLKDPAGGQVLRILRCTVTYTW
jgi:hypothetical protein